MDWDNFLELREEIIMNLVLGTDVGATNRRLKEYQVANGLLVKDAATADLDIEADRPAGKLAKQAHTRTDSSADPSGLIKGLKRKVAPVPAPPYDPFMGMPRTRSYYQLGETYESRYDRMKDQDAFSAGGYDFQQYWDESLLRAFAGLGCFIEDEMASRNPPATGTATSAPVTPKAVDDVF